MCVQFRRSWEVCLGRGRRHLSYRHNLRAGNKPILRIGIERCFNIKNRQMEKKLPILFSNAKEAAKLVEFDDRAKLIADGFWPGQVSLVLPVKSAILPEELLGRDHTLAVRVPNHECCVRLITSCGNSLVGTSANVSGTSPFVDPEDPLLLEFARKADYFVKGICGKSRLPSTILESFQKRSYFNNQRRRSF